jgi:hypothetical protein
MPAQAQSFFVPAPDAERIVEYAAAPALPPVAQGVAQTIPAMAPGSTGRKYHPAAGSGFLTSAGEPMARVWPNCSIWHLLEYGSAKYANVGNPPYRVIQRAVEALGLRYEPGAQA